MHQVRYLLHNALVCAEVVLFCEDDAEVENKLVAIIAHRFHADRVAQNAISIGADLQQVPAELLAGDHEERDIGEGQEG